MLALLLNLCAAPVAVAQTWPTKPVKVIAVFPAGGSVDQVARILAQQLTEQTGQSFIVDNRGGASGSIGTAALAKADPDGYTIGVVFDTHAVNPSLIPEPAVRHAARPDAADAGRDGRDGAGDARSRSRTSRSATSSPRPRPSPAACPTARSAPAASATSR